MWKYPAPSLSILGPNDVAAPNADVRSVAGGSSIIGISSASMASSSATPIVSPYVVSFKSFFDFPVGGDEGSSTVGMFNGRKRTRALLGSESGAVFRRREGSVSRSLRRLRRDDGRDT